MNENSLKFWFPKIKDLGIPVPRTFFCHTLDETFQAADQIGYPVFLRTDLCAGKHDWDKSCFVQSKSQLRDNLFRIEQANERWTMLGIPFECSVVREFLDLETSFTAFAGNMPINKERRYFVKDGEVICHHPYWPEDAFDRHPARMANDLDWKEKLRKLNEESGEGILTEYAAKVSRAISGYWSVDFAKAKDGQWYLLDMALGKNSYHWPCPAI